MAIALDFVIVVVGVFIGIQLGNWNGARIERAQSGIFTRALETDLRADAALYREVADYYSTVRENGERVLAALQGETPLPDEELVISAYRASQVALRPVNRSTFDELVSTGRINLITDRALRTTAIDHFGFSYIDVAQIDGRQSEYRQLFRSTVPPDAHRAARARCGDLAVDGIVLLDYTCSLGLPAGVVSRAADLLRAESALRTALRRRINQLDGQITDLRSAAAQLERTVSPFDRGAP